MSISLHIVRRVNAAQFRQNDTIRKRGPQLKLPKEIEK